MKGTPSTSEFKHTAEGNSISRRQPARIFFLFGLAIAMLASLTTAGYAQNAVTPADLSGTWVATLVGNTGCGFTAMRVYFDLNSAGSGNGTAKITGHSSGCADSTTAGLNFNIISLDSEGNGTAGLSCGPSCGWVFNIQVAAGNTVFNLVDVDPSNPGNYLAGVAIHKQ